MQWELRAVSQFTAASLEFWYARLEVTDHRQDVSAAGAGVRAGTNADARASARKDLPALRMHLALARNALAAR